MNRYPAFGLCGYSGSGKTTLIEALLPRLIERGLKVGVIKQDAHGLDLDREGKDTDRLFKAGGDVFIRDRTQTFARRHGAADADLPRLVEHLAPYYDLLLVEGHKTSPLPFKIWLCTANDDLPPPEAVGVREILRWHADRERIALNLLDDWLPEIWLSAPVYAGLLIGGGSTRMGRPKHLIEEQGVTWLHKTVEALRPHVERVVLLGRGEIPADLRGLPVLPDVEDAEGPLRGMRAALRWAPRAGWIFTACDHPDISSAAVAWLLSHRRPGVWAVTPRLHDRPHPEPLFAYYDFRMGPLLEIARRPRDVVGSRCVAAPPVPAALAPAWRNFNTPDDLDRERGCR